MPRLRLFLDALLRDLQITLRRIRAKPGVSAVVVVSLALAIGSNSAAFSLIDGLFLRPFPGLPQPERLVAIFSRDKKEEMLLPVSFLEYEYIKRHNRSLSGLFAYQVLKAAIDLGTEPVAQYGEIVSGSFFEVLGVRPT